MTVDEKSLDEIAEFHGPICPGLGNASLPCATCGEGVMETRVRRFAGADYCQPCFEAATAAS